MAVERGDAAFQQVHPRRADEAGDEDIVGIVIEADGAALLLDAPLAQHDDLVGERHRLDLVVRHVDHGGAEILVQLGDLDAHLHAQLGVEVRQRLVEQERLGLAHDGAADGDALALPAGQLPRLAVHQLLQLQHACGFFDPLGHLGPRHAAHAQAEAEIFLDRHVRIERIGLEHHGDAAFARIEIGDVLAADEDLAGGRLLEAGNRAQQRRFPAAGRADEDDEFAIADIEVDIGDDLNGAEALVDAPQLQVGHGRLSPRRISAPPTGRHARRWCASAAP